MKTLIAILLLTAVAFSQDEKPQVVYFPASGDTVLINVEGLEFKTQHNAYLFANLVKLQIEWQSYKQLCYNDSALVGDWQFVPTDTLGDGVYNGYTTYIKRWIHKEPTFAEFMEYMALGMEKMRIK